MAKLKCGHEICDTCGKRYIALLAKDSCMCEIDPSHTDPVEKETALALKYRQRARAAEDLNKVMLDALVTCECYHQGGHSEIGNMLRKLIGETK
jgi:hypothetical protein